MLVAVFTVVYEHRKHSINGVVSEPRVQVRAVKLVHRTRTAENAH